MTKTAINYPFFLLIIALTFILIQCKEDDECDGVCYEIPTSYQFYDASGNSTVSYSGQTTRLDMLSEMVQEMDKVNSGNNVDANTLKNMFANTANPFTSTSLNDADKDLKSKCAGGDPVIQSLFEGLMDSIAKNSLSTDTAINGVAGLLGGATGEKGPYLFDSKGVEYKQWIEKGLMGSVFMYQICHVYLTDSRTGDDVENSTAVDPSAGKYYTLMEHHWDEAFGYFSSATDFPANGTDRFWGKYSDVVDPVLNCNSRMMDAYLSGRAAIANQDMASKNSSRSIILSEIQKICAATAIHYLNAAMGDLNIDVNRMHALSEATAFVQSLSYGADPLLNQSEVNQVLTTIGDNFWIVSNSDLLNARQTIADAYGLNSVQDQL